MDTLDRWSKVEAVKHLDSFSLLSLCNTNTEWKNFCNTANVWRDKFFDVYGSFINRDRLDEWKSRRGYSWYQCFQKFYDADIHHLGYEILLLCLTENEMQSQVYSLDYSSNGGYGNKGIVNNDVPDIAPVKRKIKSTIHIEDLYRKTGNAEYIERFYVYFNIPLNIQYPLLDHEDISEDSYDALHKGLPVFGQRYSISPVSIKDSIVRLIESRKISMSDLDPDHRVYSIILRLIMDELRHETDERCREHPLDSVSYGSMQFCMSIINVIFDKGLAKYIKKRSRAWRQERNKEAHKLENTNKYLRKGAYDPIKKVDREGRRLMAIHDVFSSPQRRDVSPRRSRSSSLNGSPLRDRRSSSKKA